MSPRVPCAGGYTLFGAGAAAGHVEDNAKWNTGGPQQEDQVIGSM